MVKSGLDKIILKFLGGLGGNPPCPPLLMPLQNIDGSHVNNLALVLIKPTTSSDLTCSIVQWCVLFVLQMPMICSCC